MTPIVVGKIDGRHVVVTCPHCQQVHRHGAGENGAAAAGPRLSHCDQDQHRGKGYIIAVSL